MQLTMPGHLAARFKSETQRIREVSESWGEHNLFCPACPSPRLTRLPGGFQGRDFVCPKCAAYYQLKAHRQALGHRVADGQYDKMMALLRSNERPHFLLLHYQRIDWSILSLILVPSFFLPPSSIHRRKPTWPKGRNKPWVGCDVMLDRVPQQGLIEMVANRRTFPAAAVRSELDKVRDLQDLEFESRGWQLETLRVVDNLGKIEFTNDDMYAHEDELAARFPSNAHVRDKIRQQLQNLRDAGLIKHIAKGRWRRLS